MNDIKNTKGKTMCLASILIIIGCYATERLVNLLATNPENLATVLMTIFILGFLAVFVLLMKSNEPFFGMLTALLGYKMMPPNISFLSTASHNLDFIYFIVQKVAVVMFIIILVKLFYEQIKPRKINSLPIFAIMFCVPFFSEIAISASNFLMITTGNMLYCYLIQFALYTFAVLVILGVAMKSNSTSARFVAAYQLVALSINILRKICSVIFFLINGDHVSKSQYCWIAIYVVFFIVFALLLKKNKYKSDIHTV